MDNLEGMIEDVKKHIKQWSEHRFVHVPVHDYVSAKLDKTKKEFQAFCKASPELQEFISSYFDRAEDDRRDASCYDKMIEMIKVAIFYGLKLSGADITKATGISKVNLTRFSEQNPEIWNKVYKGSVPIGTKPKKRSEKGKLKPVVISQPLAPLTILEKETYAENISEFLRPLEPSQSLNVKFIAATFGLKKGNDKTVLKSVQNVQKLFLAKWRIAAKAKTPVKAVPAYTEDEINLVRKAIEKARNGFVLIDKEYLAHALEQPNRYVSGILRAYDDLTDMIASANEQITNNQSLDFGSSALCELKYYKGRLTKRITLSLSKRDLEAIGCDYSILFLTDKDKNVGIYPPPTPDIGLYPVKSSEVSTLFTMSWSPSLCKEPTIGKRVPIHLHTVVTEHRNGLWFTFHEQFFLDRFK